MLVPAFAALYILVYSYLARRLAWVQCRAGHLRVRTPILPVAISYARIKSVRPSRLSQVFDPTKERPGRREWMSLEEAARRVWEDELKTLFRKLPQVISIPLIVEA